MARGAQLEFQTPLTIRIYGVIPQPWDEDTSGYPNEVKVPYSRNIERGTKRTLGRGPQLEFQVGLPVRAPAANVFEDTDGAASGDSTVSGALDAFGDFAGAASGDSTASGGLDAFGDFAGAASGDATASGGLSALADFDGAASGDSTASGEITGRYDFPLSATYHLLTQQGARRKQREIVEKQRPLPIAIINRVDGDGAASGDSTASGGLDAFGDFAGAASGDSTVSGTLDAFGDFAGSAIGDATASGGLDAFGDFAGAASGDSTASAEATARYDFPLSATCHLLTQQGARRKQREIIERSRPIPITAFTPAANGDGDGSAIGDSQADGELTALADFAGSAIGDATVSGALDAFADMAGSAIGDSTASGAQNALADMAGAASGDSTVSGALDALANFVGAASGDATVDGTITALADFAGSAIGDSTASGALDALADLSGAATGDAIADAEGAVENNQDTDGSAIGDSTASGGLDALADMAGSATGDATCEGFIEDATPAVVEPSVVVDAGGAGGQVFRGAWTDRIKKPKRKKRLDDLDEMIAELRSRIEEVPAEATAEDIYQRALRVSQALASQPDPSLRAIDNQIVLLRAAINEIDDEEAILLLAA
jgi:hypothetical protein